MTGELIPASQKALVTERLTFTTEQIDLIRRTLCKEATNDELAMFVGQCQRTGLDPFAKQIYLVKRQGKMCIQTGIDGFRLIAERSGQYAGNDDPVFDDEDNPRKATVTVYKIINGIRCPFTASARWTQYYPGDALGFMWKKMPHVMLGKCAESLALRKAFPQELSGLYTAEEMHQADAAAPAQKVDVRALAEGEITDDPPDVELVNELLGNLRDCRTKGEVRAITVKKIPGYKAEGKLTPAGLERLRSVATELLAILPEAEAEPRKIEEPPVKETAKPDMLTRLIAEYTELGGEIEDFAAFEGTTIAEIKASRTKARSAWCDKLEAALRPMRGDTAAA